jgi:DNA-3-methyladenine glycosylase
VDELEKFEILKPTFYARAADIVARKLLGKLLIKKGDGLLKGGMIVETEAYYGEQDPASHAYNGRTLRNAVMYSAPGLAYVYLCYGMHYLFNVVTEKEGKAGAVLIRALEPLYGFESLLHQAKKNPICSGPGKLTKALGIDKKDNGLDITLARSAINIIDAAIEIKKEAVGSSPRVGIKKALHLPLRFISKTIHLSQSLKKII